MCKEVCLWMCCQIWLKEADNRLSEHGGRRHSGGCSLNAHAATPGSSSLKQMENRQPASRERYLKSPQAGHCVSCLIVFFHITVAH